MLETETSLKPPQITDMFQKLALAFKTKTIEFFAEEAEVDDDAVNDISLDSPEEVITGQRVVVIKPDQNKSSPNPDVQTLHTLISSLFAIISSFKASYLHLQTAHAPFDPVAIQAADGSAVSHLQRLSQIKQSYQNSLKNPNPNSNPDPRIPFASHLEAQVQENQSLLRTFDMVINRLQSEIDCDDAEAAVLRQQLEAVEDVNARYSKRLDDIDSASSSSGVLLSVSLFDSVLQDACRAAHSFTKILIDLMMSSGWNLDSAANSVHPGIDYAKRGHNRYAILSYVCLGMFGGFDSERFCLDGNGVASDLTIRRKKFLRQFVEHGSMDAMELLNGYPECDFARFCDLKYQQLIHPNMESSLFDGELDQRESVLNSWRSSTPFYEAFVGMASAVWMLHKLAFSFDPTVGIFQVERGVDFSMVYMENITRKHDSANTGGGCKTRAKVGFTVIPGFRVGKTVIQCQVYLNGMKCAE